MTGRVFTFTDTAAEPGRVSVHLEGMELARFSRPTRHDNEWHLTVPDGRLYMVVPVGDFDAPDGVS